MNKLKKELLDEIEDFRKLGHKFVSEELSVMEFKKYSGGMGVYAERNKKTFMIRLRIPSGITNLNELKIIYNIAKKYGLEKIHLTTREAIQLHNLSIDEVCNIMKFGLENNIYTRGAGGNYPRNVAMSPLAGVDRFEAFDVTPYALAVNNYFLDRITQYKLPRKLKVSFSSSNMDLGHCNITDLGFLAVRRNNENYFKVYMGGGLGRNPRVAIEYDELINPNEVLYYVEAMVKLFMEEGDYENRNKARIRYILERMGRDEFIRVYKNKLKEIEANSNLKIDIRIVDIRKKGKEISKEHLRLYKQKQNGLYSVYFHPIGGQFYIKDLKNIIDNLESIEDLEIRLTMTEGVYFRNLNGDEANKILDITENIGGETHLEQSVSCIGVPTCQVGILESQTTLNNIINYFKEKNYNKDVLPRIHISGCGNSCGIHEAVLLGLTGKRKKINDKLEDVFELHMNGSFEEGKAILGKIYGDLLAKDIPEFLYRLALLVEKKNINFGDYIKQYEDELIELVNEYKK